MSCLGIGSVAGSLIVANWSNPTIRRVAMMSFIFGVSLAIVAIIPTLQLSFPAIAIMGLASSLFLASCSSCLQINAGESMHGRVMSFYYVVFLGVAPIGGPLVGAIAQVMGPRIGFLTGAIACILASGLFFLMRSQATHNTGDEKAA
jgi:MFS family permease